MSVNYDSIVNQRILSKLVDREVLCCVSSLIDHLIKHPEGTEHEYELMNLCQSKDWEAAWDGADKKLVKDSDGDTYIVDNDYQPPERGPDMDDDEYEIECDSDLMAYGEAYDGDDDDYQALCEAANIDPEYRDVYEHWAVTSWFAERLSEQGETVEEVFGLHVWGRCCTGQAIHMDGVIGAIGSSMGILAGQPHSWADDQ